LLGRYGDLRRYGVVADIRALQLRILLSAWPESISCQEAIDLSSRNAARLEIDRPCCSLRSSSS
jgi:hypothetical protein